MTDDERKQVIQMIFAEIREDHSTDGLKVEFRARAAWEPTENVRPFELDSSVAGEAAAG